MANIDLALRPIEHSAASLPTTSFTDSDPRRRSCTAPVIVASDGVHRFRTVEGMQVDARAARPGRGSDRRRSAHHSSPSFLRCLETLTRCNSRSRTRRPRIRSVSNNKKDSVVPTRERVEFAPRRSARTEQNWIGEQLQPVQSELRAAGARGERLAARRLVRFCLDERLPPPGSDRSRPARDDHSLKGRTSRAFVPVILRRRGMGCSHNSG
jgi:hypothetical protein